MNLEYLVSCLVLCDGAFQSVQNSDIPFDERFYLLELISRDLSFISDNISDIVLIND